MPRDLDAPTVVIAHGAWIGTVGWCEVIALLQAEGSDVVAVQTPLSSLADDVDVVTRAIRQRPGPVVLVGHGYGGTVITQAGNHPRAAALVYVAAFAPDADESTADAQKSFPPLPCVSELEIDGAGFLYLAQDAVSEFLAQDLPDADSRVLAAAQQPIRASTLLDRVGAAAWHDRPCWYAVAEEDRMIPRTLQREIANRIKARIHAIHSGHLPFLSKPEQTAGVIMRAVDFVRKGLAIGTIAAPRNRE